MDDQDWLAERFEANRSHSRGVAFRMLGSLTEADDALVHRDPGLSAADRRAPADGRSGPADLAFRLKGSVGRECPFRFPAFRQGQHGCTGVPVTSSRRGSLCVPNLAGITSRWNRLTGPWCG